MKKKNNSENVSNLTTEELIEKFTSKRRNLSRVFVFLPLVAICVAIPTVFVFNGFGHLKDATTNELGTISLAVSPSAATTAKDVISIPTGVVKKNPFLPYRDIGNKNVSSDIPKFEILEPPTEDMVDNDAVKIMDTVVSGILFDTYSPSAILNIENKDYLVKKGDVVNDYKILAIERDSVTVKLGANTYKAGIGEILTEGSIHHNEVSNLKNKFGGERR